MNQCVRISREDKALIRAYVRWTVAKHSTMPLECDCSNLIENMNSHHRDEVENYLSELGLKRAQGEAI